ncbi:MAG: CopG family transcriptional regulator [Rhodocyclaceae bacterium]|nr:CopG family transcriptional regulator [Rhodocyclaceae bacterium]MDP1957761.1 CopG family transcriptional regulator [Rhodocyclaceae bacterium]
MALSVRLDPILETRLDQEAKRLGVTKSEFVKDALERVLGIKDPYALLMQVRDPEAYRVCEPTTFDAENVSVRVKEKLCAKHHR